jgi:hypothetical protein
MLQRLHCAHLRSPPRVEGDLEGGPWVPLDLHIEVRLERSQSQAASLCCMPAGLARDVDASCFAVDRHTLLHRLRKFDLLSLPGLSMVRGSLAVVAKSKPGG